jgi:hypothetical protein
MAAKKKKGSELECFAMSGKIKEIMAFEIQCDELPRL